MVDQRHTAKTMSHEHPVGHRFINYYTLKTGSLEVNYRPTLGIMAGSLFKLPENKLLIIGLQLMYPFVVFVKN